MPINFSRALNELLAVKALFWSSDRWTQNVLAKDSKGVPVSYSSFEAVCWCLDGAFCKTLNTDYVSLYSTSPGHQVLDNYLRETYNMGVVGFNDSTNFIELHRALDDAIARVKRSLSESH